jgi:hypothetical protein
MLETKTLKSVRDEAFKKAQSMEFNNTDDMYKIKPYYELSYAIEKFLKATTLRIRPFSEHHSEGAIKLIKQGKLDPDDARLYNADIL